jgi:hypothetical protein
MPLYLRRIWFIFSRYIDGIIYSTRVSVNYRYSVPRLSSPTPFPLSLPMLDFGL